MEGIDEVLGVGDIADNLLGYCGGVFSVVGLILVVDIASAECTDGGDGFRLVTVGVVLDEGDVLNRAVCHAGLGAAADNAAEVAVGGDGEVLGGAVRYLVTCNIVSDDTSGLVTVVVCRAGVFRNGCNRSAVHVAVLDNCAVHRGVSDYSSCIVRAADVHVLERNVLDSAEDGAEKSGCGISWSVVRCGQVADDVVLSVECALECDCGISSHIADRCPV